MADTSTPYTITPEQAQERFERGLQLTAMWIQIWTDNPDLAKKAGRRVEEFMMSRDEVRARYAAESDWSLPPTAAAVTATDAATTPPDPKP